MVSGGDAAARDVVELRWRGGVVLWRAATPGLAAAAAGGEEGAVDWGMEVPGLPSADSGRCFI